ncbi:50S ribosomal protein L29 [Wolbachia endosymbiont of Atemnus politus]|uniref:50S ribosomal protein L29 n=1 Tax=Wolbachia endosymbiont of Atemnus politus TaxID=2682840 RepID=UPI00157337F6|nr:50S ribosomal protein L29 [Wolbachia endosymbiont of Atemnus politus]NSX83488.1 50S ribosomal protein L29 [Wolbachia endosymbiont of Atemnus politus]
MNIADVRSKSSQELYEILVNFRKQFVNLVFQKKLGQCSDISRFGLIRKSIARILTVLSERRIEERNA